MLRLCLGLYPLSWFTQTNIVPSRVSPSLSAVLIDGSAQHSLLPSGCTPLMSRATRIIAIETHLFNNLRTGLLVQPRGQPLVHLHGMADFAPTSQFQLRLWVAQVNQMLQDGQCLPDVSVHSAPGLEAFGQCKLCPWVIQRSGSPVKVHALVKVRGLNPVRAKVRSLERETCRLAWPIA